MATRYNSILETIGKTPVVRLNRLAPAGVEVWAKLEYFNPLSSVKDRLALAVIEDARRSGALKPGRTVIEATSGNTGIGLAMVCAAKGHPLVVTMAETFSLERRRVLRALGAKVILTPAAERGTGMVKKAKELAEKHGWFLTRQFEAQANVEYHANTTGPEILLDFAGHRLDFFVTGYGTGGTFTGAGRVLKAGRPGLKIVLAEPEAAPLVTSGAKQKRLGDGSAAEAHPAFTPHPIQGWTPDFIPLLLEQGLNKNLADSVVKVAGSAAISTALALASQEGIFTGISGGASMRAALDLAATAPAGTSILAMLPDTGERYLSSAMFADIKAEMNDEEISISKSTPGQILH